MPWLQVDTALGESNPEHLEPLLEELGAIAVWFSDAGDEPVLEPALGTTPLWTDTIVSALFPAHSDEIVIANAIEKQIKARTVSFHAIQDRDWPAEWQKSLHPIKFGNNIWVCPAANNTTPEDGVKIQLTPGMAFGTGEHPTTAMCLTWLETIAPGMTDASVLDYGCGSGLLSIAALKLGAGHATAVDLDPQALLATQQNCTMNDCAQNATICLPQDLPRKQHEVLLANILSKTLIELSPTLNKLTSPGAMIALSGILETQAVAVCESWSDWATLGISQQTNEWVLLSGIKHK